MVYFTCIERENPGEFVKWKISTVKFREKNQMKWEFSYRFFPKFENTLGGCLLSWNFHKSLLYSVTLRWTSIPGEVEIPSVASCYRSRDKLRPDGSLGQNADSTYRKLVETKLPPTRIYPFTVLSGERHREQECSTVQYSDRSQGYNPDPSI